jgi:hypothetical protein
MLGSAALALAAPPETTGAQGAGVFRGYLDTRSRRGAVQFTLRVAGYTSPADLSGIETMLQEKGQEAVFAAIGDMKVNGWLALDNRLGYPVTVLGEQATATGRRIVALANRPLQFAEFWRGSRSLDYPFTLIVLDIDASGSGQGTLVPAARAELDAQGHIAFDDYLRIPLRIMRLREDRT